MHQGRWLKVKNHYYCALDHAHLNCSCVRILTVIGTDSAVVASPRAAIPGRGALPSLARTGLERSEESVHSQEKLGGLGWVDFAKLCDT